MKKRKHTKIVHEGAYVAEVEIELIEIGSGWEPYLTPGDAYKLGEVREALRSGDIARASKLSRVFTLTPVNA
jgi:hypothetical protein